MKRLGTPALDNDAAWNVSRGVLVPNGTVASEAESFETSLRELVQKEEAAHATRKERQEKR